MVVRIKPEKRRCKREILLHKAKVISLPFLHLTGGDVDAVSLTPSTHGEIDVKRRQTLANITLGNNVEGSRMIEHMVIEGKFAAKIDWLDVVQDVTKKRNNLGT